MADPWKKNRKKYFAEPLTDEFSDPRDLPFDEYSNPEYSASDEYSDPVTREVREAAKPNRPINVPDWEKRNLPPEITPPGKYHWEKPGAKRDKAVKMMAMITAIIIILINMQILTGDTADALADILNIEESTTQEETGINTETETPGTDVTEDTSGPESTTQSDPGGQEGSDVSASSSADVTTATEATTTAPVFEVPDCDMTVFACYSEMMGSLKFTGTHNVTKITLEVWDVLTNSLEESHDITNEISEDGVYTIKPFTTDEIYMHHQKEYDEIFTFPMQVEFKVIIDYDTETGTDQKTFSHVTLMDRNVWHAKYIHDEDRAMFSDPINILFTTDSLDGEATVLFDQPEKAGPNVFSITLMVDGEKLDISKSIIHRSSYDISGDGSEVHYYSDVYILLPDGFDETKKHDIKLYVYHYLEEYKKVCETVFDIEI